MCLLGSSDPTIRTRTRQSRYARGPQSLRARSQRQRQQQRQRSVIPVPDLARKHRPDLILMDIQLPEVSGLEVTKWLKEDPELKAIPVVAVTAFAMKGDEERIREGGCEAYLSKPISVAKFIETIRRFLGVGLTIPAVSRGQSFAH
jgi:two-component system, cell cycle response regulator DivK